MTMTWWHCQAALNRLLRYCTLSLLLLSPCASFCLPLCSSLCFPFAPHFWQQPCHPRSLQLFECANMHIYAQQIGNSQALWVFLPVSMSPKTENRGSTNTWCRHLHCLSMFWISVWWYMTLLGRVWVLWNCGKRRNDECKRVCSVYYQCPGLSTFQLIINKLIYSTEGKTLALRTGNVK